MTEDNQQQWHQFNKETIEALVADGTNINEQHLIEHHFACNNFDRLEKVALEVFKLGFEVTDAEEVTLDDGGILFCFDATVEKQLDIDSFNQDTDKLFLISQKNKVHYDGWGTYFIQRDN